MNDFPLHKKPAAFTLVEVALSLGIMSFALVALIGMLPVGLSTFRDSVNLTIESQIAQQLYTDIQQTPFADSPALSGDYYFNDEGFRSDPAQFHFHAKVTVASAGEQLPSSNGGLPNADVRKVTIEIARNRPVNVESSGDLRTYAYVIANTGI